ncbi:aminoglycoside phosphotransferase family protein [Streptomyces sp. ODS28]|uniref:aminoglycoside phosphotransferase family protein n=1 Tax=Streptomyces sp. ODS28 TaxID=3136688 RepID=UPI0031EE66E5
MAALIPDDLPVVTTMGRHESGRAWLERLPELITELRERWQMRLGAPYQGGSCSWVAPAVLPDGGHAVFKVSWPHPEMLTEPTGLRLWDGRGAVRMYAYDAERYALLLERCEPGTELARSHEVPAERRLREACAVLRELWAADPAGAGLGTVAEVAGEWADLAEERAGRQGWPPELDAGLFRTAADLLRDLPRTAGRDVVVHGDFNPGNLLAARRSPWLAIDPKPMSGDPAFDPWPLIEQVDDPFATPDPRRTLRRRTALVADELGEDVSRVRAWAVARHVEYVLWSVDEDETLEPSVQLLRQARVLAEVARL